jgi:hypothetical protein
VFQATSEVTGVGHASFAKSPDGSEDWIVYHAHANPTTFNEDRVIRIQPFTFNSNGTPNFGQPVPPGQVLDVPSVGPDPERPMVAGDYQADGNVNNLDYTLWRTTFGSTVFPGVAADGNSSGAADAGDYVLWRKAVSSASSQLAPTLARPATNQPSSDSEARVENQGDVVAPTTPSTFTVGPSSKTGHSLPPAPRLTTEQHHDDALLALLSSRPRDDHKKHELAPLKGSDDPQTSNESASLRSALDAIVISLLI